VMLAPSLFGWRLFQFPVTLPSPPLRRVQHSKFAAERGIAADKAAHVVLASTVPCGPLC
jgi:hypothetical protein